MSLHDECLEIYRREGSHDVAGVHRHIQKRYPEPEARVRALTDLENTGFWQVKWHYSSRVPGHTKDDGIVLAYLG